MAELLIYLANSSGGGETPRTVLGVQELLGKVLTGLADIWY